MLVKSKTNAENLDDLKETFVTKVQDEAQSSKMCLWSVISIRNNFRNSFDQSIPKKMAKLHY